MQRFIIAGLCVFTLAFGARMHAQGVQTATAPPRGLAPTATTQTTSKADVDALPVGRRPVDIAELSPLVTTNTYTAGQLAIGGAFGFDNVFMVNGVDTNDNIFGTSNNLF